MRTRLQVVDALLSGTHEPGTSHYELLGAFLTDAELEQLTTELNMREYHTHEFGDSVLVSRTFNKLAEDKPRCQIPMSELCEQPSLVDLNHQPPGPELEQVKI